MGRTVVSFAALVLTTLFLSLRAHAQEIPPQAYLFVEVADATGEVVVDANVRVSNADGKEVLNLKTSTNGTVQTRFYRGYPNRYYDLQVTKTGYLPYESVLVPNNLDDHYFAVANLTEEMPNTTRPSNERNGPLVKITLRETPSTPAEAKKQQLLFAAKRGDAASLRKLLQQGVNANSADVKGVPAVVWATFAGDPETIKLLLDAGANVRKPVAHEALLIYLAEGVFRGRVQAEIIQRLIDAGADVNASNSYWGTVLNKAIIQVPSHALTIETIRALIKAGADVNAADATGQTPLMLAARHNQPELLDLLLSSGAKRSLNAKDKDGLSAIIYAAGYRDSTLAIIKVLMANGGLVNEADEAGETPLMLAARGASVETIQILLKAGSAINAKDKQGQTPLMYAVISFYQSNPDVLQTVKLLLAAGARVNDVDANGRSALIFAIEDYIAEEQKIEIVRLLLRSGANVNITDKEGRTPIALAQKRSQTAIVKLLEESRH